MKKYVDTITAKSLEYILSGYQVTPDDFGSLINLMESFANEPRPVTGKTKEGILKNKESENHIYLNGLEKNVCYEAMEEYATQSSDAVDIVEGYLKDTFWVDHFYSNNYPTKVMPKATYLGMIAELKRGKVSNKETQSDAVEFAEWCSVNSWIYYPIDNYWAKNLNWKVAKTTSELYSIFLKEKGGVNP